MTTRYRLVARCKDGWLLDHVASTCHDWNRVYTSVMLDTNCADDETAIWRTEAFLGEMELRGYELVAATIFEINDLCESERTVWYWRGKNSGKNEFPPVAQGTEQGPSKSEADGSSPSRRPNFLHKILGVTPQRSR